MQLNVQLFFVSKDNFAPGFEGSITSGVSTVWWCADVVITDHCGLGFTGEVAARGLVERPAARRAVARAVCRRVSSSITGYRWLPT